VTPLTVPVIVQHPPRAHAHVSDVTHDSSPPYVINRRQPSHVVRLAVPRVAHYPYPTIQRDRQDGRS
jgi:hypothetical protein